MYKKIFIIMLLLFIPFFVHAEEIDINLLTSFGGNSSDIFDRLIVKDDYIFAFGTTHSGDLDGSMGSGDAVVVKYDKEGNKIWERIIGGTDYDYFSDAIITENNEILVFGTFKSIDIPELNNNGIADVFVMKYDLDGNLLFSKSIGGNDSDSLKKAYLVDDGYILIGTFFSSNFESLQNKGLSDLYIIKYDKDWNVVCKSSWGGGKIELITNSYLTSDEEIIISGYFYSNDIEGISINGSDDVMLLKYDSDCSLLWQKNWGGSGSEEFNEIIFGHDDSIFASAITNSKDIFVNEVNSNNLLLKYDKDGNLLFQKNLGGSSYDTLKLSFSVDDGFIMIGQYKSTDIEGLENKGGTDGIIAKFDNNGNLLWQSGLGGNSSDAFQRAYLNDNNEIIVMATFSSTDIDGLENKGQSDLAILKYDKNGNLILKKSWGGNGAETFYNAVLGNENNIYMSLTTRSSDIETVENNGNPDAVLLNIFFKYELQINENGANGTSNVEQQGTLGIIKSVPNKGYEVGEIIVKDNEGNVLDVEVIKLEDGTYTFPLYTDVMIDIIYKEKLVNPKTGVSSFIGVMFTLLLIGISGFFMIRNCNNSYEL